MKKTVCVLIIIAIAVCALVGCGKKDESPFTADNDICTYKKIDPKKTQLTVSSLGNNANIKELSSAFEEHNPDIQVVCFDLTGGTAEYSPMREGVVNGNSPDIMFINANSFSDHSEVMKYFEDLSANPAIGNFKAESLNRVAVDGFLYYLPAPSEINCMIYNKTLFEQYGWEVPTTFDEFVKLCVQIREDTDGSIEA